MNFQITGIHFTNTSAFVLTGRNKENSKFYIRPKSDYEREQELGENGFVGSNLNEGVREESKIIEMMESGKKFYTHINKEFTPVTIVNGNLKSIKNGTTKDNISELPIAKICSI
jgi:hypothetical protein